MGEIAQRWQAYLATQQREPSKANSVHASWADDPCLRRMVYRCVAGEKAQSAPASLQSVFWLGTTLADDWQPMFSALGYKVLKQEPDATWPAQFMSGTTDFKVLCPDGASRYLEFKTCGHVFDAINEPEDLLKQKMPFRAWYGQVQVYCLLYGVEDMILLLLDKLGGRVKDWLVRLDLEYAEMLVQKAISIRDDWIHRWVLNHDDMPARIQDMRECDRCSFNHICLPDWSPPTGEFDDNPSLLEALEEQERLKELVADRKEAMDVIKHIIGERETVVAPGWIVRRTWTRPQTSIPKPRGGFFELNIRRSQ